MLRRAAGCFGSLLARWCCCCTPAATLLQLNFAAACDGGGGALGHPRVYLEMGGKDEVDCPYCGRKFKLSAKAAAAH